MINPSVSIVITTKNSEKIIGDCLKSIKNQTYPQKKIETIVVDNNSSDKTKKIAFSYTQKVFNKGPERSAQRNFGAKKSRGYYYLYLDTDMTLDENVIQECVEKFENNKQLSGLYIPEIIIGKGLWSKVRRFERSFYDSTVIDCVRFIKIKDFIKVKGFDESLTGPEDWDFDKKIRNRGQVDIITSPLYHNEQDFKLKKYLEKKNYYTRSISKYIAKWGKSDPDIKKQLGFSYRYFWVFVENSKWKRLITNPLETFIMLFLKILVGLQYLRKTLWSN